MKKIKCEVFTRVVGYFRPVNQFNKGKKEEFMERVYLGFKKEDLYEKRNRNENSSTHEI